MVATEEITDPIADAWHRAWAPPDRRGTIDFATEHVVLEGDYAETGRFRIRNSRYLVRPFAYLDNDVTRMLNVLKAPRTGGSLVGDVWLQKTFATRPAPFMCTFQTDDDAERHYLTKIKKTFEATRVNAPRFAQLEKKRDLYQFPHMNLYVQGANMNSLQSKGVKYEWNDEVWIWKPGMMEQAFTRTEDFKRVCKILNISQGGNVGSEWEIVYNQGKRHDYAIRCEACGRLQALEFFATMRDPATRAEVLDERGKPIRAGIVWDQTARTNDGRWNITRASETTRFRCCYCGHDHTDEPRTWERFGSSADYVCHDPERRDVDVSLRWNALVGGDWFRLTKKFLQACEVRDFSGATQPLEDFYKKQLATFWDPSLGEQKVHLATTAEFTMEAPFSPGYRAAALEWEANRFITADYQDGTGGDTRHLLVVCRAWADETHNRSRLLWWGRCNTFAQLYQLQLALAVRPANVGVDGSFEMAEVAAQCAKYGWTMLVGDDPDYFLHKRKKGPPLRRPFSPFFKYDPLKGKKGAGRAFAVAMFWSNPAIKQMLWNLRHGRARHRWEIPSDVPPDYRDGIDSEVKRNVIKKDSPVAVPTFVKIKRYNHPWDDECMQVVLAVAAGLLTFDIEEDEQPADPKAAPSEKKSGAPSAPHHQPDQLELLPT